MPSHSSHQCGSTTFIVTETNPNSHDCVVDFLQCMVLLILLFTTLLPENSEDIIMSIGIEDDTQGSDTEGRLICVWLILDMASLSTINMAVQL